MDEVIVSRDAYNRRIHFEVEVINREFTEDPNYRAELFKGEKGSYFKMVPEQGLNLDKYGFILHHADGSIKDGHERSPLTYPELVELILSKIDVQSDDHSTYQLALKDYAKSLQTHSFWNPKKVVVDAVDSLALYKIFSVSSCSIPFTCVSTVICPFTWPLLFISIFTSSLSFFSLWKKGSMTRTLALPTFVLTLSTIKRGLKDRYSHFILESRAFKIKFAFFCLLPFILYFVYQFVKKSLKDTTPSVVLSSNEKRLVSKLFRLNQLSPQERYNLIRKCLNTRAEKEHEYFSDRLWLRKIGSYKNSYVHYPDEYYYVLNDDQLQDFCYDQDSVEAFIYDFADFFNEEFATLETEEVYNSELNSENIYSNLNKQLPRKNLATTFKTETIYNTQPKQLNRLNPLLKFKPETIYNIQPKQSHRIQPKFTFTQEIADVLPSTTLEPRNFKIENNLSYTAVEINRPLLDLADKKMAFFERPVSEYLSDKNAQEIINSCIYRNLHWLEIINPDSTGSFTNVLFISGHVGVTTAHSFASCVEDTLLKFNHPSFTNFVVPYSSIKTFRVSSTLEENGSSNTLHRDLVYFIIPPNYCQSFPTLVKKFLPANKLFQNINITAVCFAFASYGSNTVLQMHYTDATTFRHDLLTSSNEKDNSIFNLFDYFYHRSTTTYGCCGAPLVLMNCAIPEKILGIHAAGSADKGLALAISREEIDFVLNQFQAQSLTFSNFSDVPHLNPLCSFSPIKVKDLPSELSPGNYMLCGKINNSIFVPKVSKISPSLVYDEIVPHTTIPAHLESFNNINIYTNNLRKYFGETAYFTPDMLEFIQSRLVHRFRGAEYYSLSIADAIQGDEIITALDRSTSPGLPWILQKQPIKGKGPWLGQNENWVVDHKELLASIKYFEDEVHNNNAIPPIFFLDQTKDERRPIDKVNSGKTRMFAIGPMHFTILFRQKFAWFDSHFKRNRINNGSLVGIDPTSEEWTQLYRKLCLVNNPTKNCFLAGDYSNFDGSLNRALLWTIFDSIVEIGGNIPQKDLVMMRALWTCLTDSLHIHKGVIYQLNHSQPSGNSFTTVINTMYNLGILDYVIYYILSEQKQVFNDMDSHYNAFAYGDDNFIVFSDYLSSLIDPTEITRIMQILGHTYTTDLKDGSIQKYRPLTEISILKRRLQYDSKLAYCFAPLELDTILEMLNWDKEKIYSGKRTQLHVNCDTIQRELVHHSVEIYNKYWNHLILNSSVVKKHGYKPRNGLPCFVQRISIADKSFAVV